MAIPGIDTRHARSCRSRGGGEGETSSTNITREQALANLDRIACRALSELRGGTWVPRPRVELTDDNHAPQNDDR
jgi:hypothetical protein